MNNSKILIFFIDNHVLCKTIFTLLLSDVCNRDSIKHKIAPYMSLLSNIYLKNNRLKDLIKSILIDQSYVKNIFYFF